MKMENMPLTIHLNVDTLPFGVRFMDIHTSLSRAQICREYILATVDLCVSFRLIYTTGVHCTVQSHLLYTFYYSYSSVVGVENVRKVIAVRRKI